MVTMKEIANKAGVSVSTVSLVLNGRDEGRVKSKIADNVRAIATKLGYQSNPLASSLRTGRTHILGFISEEVATTPYAGGMILGAQTAASQFGYMLITVSTDGENSESEEIAALKRYGTDGFLYAKMSNRITHVPSSLAKTPLVLVDATDSLGKIPSVEPDEFQIGYDATTRLVKAGCARIAYVGCLEPLIAQDDRLEGYQAALRDAGLDYDDHLVVSVPVVQTGDDIAVGRDDTQCNVHVGQCKVHLLGALGRDGEVCQNDIDLAGYDWTAVGTYDNPFARSPRKHPQPATNPCRGKR